MKPFYIKQTNTMSFNQFLNWYGVSVGEYENAKDVIQLWHDGEETALTSIQLLSDNVIHCTKIELYKDIKSIPENITPFATLSEVRNFINTGSVTVYRGGSGSFDPERISTNSYSLDVSVAERYCGYVATHSKDDAFMTKHKEDGWVVSGDVDVKDVIIYTNLQFEKELIINDKLVNNIEVLR